MLNALFRLASHIHWSKMLLILLQILSFSLNATRAFDAGFLELGSTIESGRSTTHYSMTICALARVTIDYLKTAYTFDTTYLERKFNESHGECQGNIIDEIVNVLKTSQSYGINPSQLTTLVQTIASANTKLDIKELLEKESHFDSESFIDASQLIINRYQAAVVSVLNDDDFDQARNTFGEMLHTVQDFYSHTNYIELSYTTPNEIVGQRVFRENEFASTNMRTCISCVNDNCQTPSNLYETILQNKILTSGYFIPIGLNLFQPSKPDGKCSHGGLFDATSYIDPTGGINKDSLSAIHGYLHYSAATVAYLATTKMLNQFRQRIGDDNFGLFLALKMTLNSLVILIDTTYSTLDYLQLAKNISLNIVNQYSPSKYAPHNYILVTFNISTAQVIVNSRNPNDLLNGIRTLTSNQTINSTMGEMYYHALVAGLIRCEYASVFFSFTDSAAKDSNLKYEARALLRSKQAVIYSFISEQMTANLTTTSPIDLLDNINSDTDLVTISGGLTLPITATDQSAISQFVLRRLEWATIKSIFICKSDSTVVDFYVDSSIETLLIDISSLGQITNINRIELRMPNSSLYPIAQAYTSTKYLYMWKIVQPNPGSWRLTTSNVSRGFKHDVQIQGISGIGCSSTLQEEMKPNTDSTGYTRLTIEPVINSSLLILTTCENLAFPNVTISMIDQAGLTIVSYSPSESNQFGTLTRISVPQKQFRIQTVVSLPNGTKIQRLEKQLISPTLFSIEVRSQPRLISPGQTVNMSYTIKSAVYSQVTVRLQVTDTANLLNTDDIEKYLTFVNQTSGIQTMALPKNNTVKSATNLVIFSVSTQNNQTKKFSNENDETLSVYLNINSAPVVKTIRCLMLFLLSLLYYIRL